MRSLLRHRTRSVPLPSNLIGSHSDVGVHSSSEKVLVFTFSPTWEPVSVSLAFAVLRPACSHSLVSAFSPLAKPETEGGKIVATNSTIVSDVDTIRCRFAAPFAHPRLYAVQHPSASFLTQDLRPWRRCFSAVGCAYPSKRTRLVPRCQIH